MRLCFQNLTSGPGAGGPRGTGYLAALAGGATCWAEEWPEGCSIVWMMDASVLGTACFLNRHKNIICSEEMNSHRNVTNLFLGDLVLFICEVVCVLKSLVLSHWKM